MATAWKLAHDEAIECRHWDDEWVVYNKLTGDLHVVNARAILLLRRLEHGPADANDLAAALRRASPAMADGWMIDGSVSDIEAMLEAMHACTLVEPV